MHSGAGCVLAGLRALAHAVSHLCVSRSLAKGGGLQGKHMMLHQGFDLIPPAIEGESAKWRAIPDN